MPRRERWSILADILRTIRDMESGDGGRVTNLAGRAGLPYDRLQKYLDELAEAGLVTRDKMPRLTPEGRTVLERYEALREVMDRFGLD